MKSTNITGLSLSALALAFTACTAPQSAQKTAAMVNSNPSAEVVSELRHFPAAKAGQQRLVIYLPEKTREQEGDYKLEIMPGKMARVDCNRHFISGNLEKKDLQGFGYNYYEFTSNGEMGSTQMACPDGKMTDKFVYGQTELLDYNSRLPIVVYVPNGFQLKYRVWSASAMGDAK